MTTMLLKRNERLGMIIMLFVFFFCMVENDASDGVGQWYKTTRGIGNSKLRILTILFLSC
jgi:hypothetical protein